MPNGQSRERESLTAERTRIINLMKSALARLGIRGFKPQPRKAPQLVEVLRTQEDVPSHRIRLRKSAVTSARWAILRDQIEKEIEQALLQQLEDTPQSAPNAMVRLLASVIGLGIETAYLLVLEVFSRDLRDRRAVARYAGLTGAPDESGSKRREKGLDQGGQCPRTPRSDPARLAVSAVSEGQRVGRAVPQLGPRGPAVHAKRR